MAKSKVEKNNELLKEIMNESNIEGKMSELENQLEEINKWRETYVSQDDYVSKRLKEDRDENGEYIDKKEWRLYRDIFKNEFDKLGRENKQKEEGIKRKLAFYKNYITNKDKILNIRKFQLALQAENRKLKDIVCSYENSIKSVDDIKKLDVECERLMKIKDEKTKALKNPNLNEKEKETLKSEITVINNQLNINSKKFVELGNKKEDIDLDGIKAKIYKNNVLIEKCNCIWLSLLKGQDEKDIIENLKKIDKAEEAGTMNFDNVYNIEDTGKELKSQEKSDKDDGNEFEVFDELVKKNKKDQEKNISGSTDLDLTFEQKHPFISKIPGLRNIWKKIEDKNAQKKLLPIEKEKKEIPVRKEKVENGQNTYNDFFEKANKGINLNKMLLNITNTGSIKSSILTRKGYKDQLKVLRSNETLMEKRGKQKEWAEMENDYKYENDKFSNPRNYDGR